MTPPATYELMFPTVLDILVTLFAPDTSGTLTVIVCPLP